MIRHCPNCANPYYGARCENGCHASPEAALDDFYARTEPRKPHYRLHYVERRGRGFAGTMYFTLTYPEFVWFVERKFDAVFSVTTAEYPTPQSALEAAVRL